mgnify:FL=1
MSSRLFEQFTRKKGLGQGCGAPLRIRFVDLAAECNQPVTRGAYQITQKRRKRCTQRSNTTTQHQSICKDTIQSRREAPPLTPLTASAHRWQVCCALATFAVIRRSPKGCFRNSEISCTLIY